MGIPFLAPSVSNMSEIIQILFHGWDPFDDSEGSFRPNVKKSPIKVSKWVPGASRPRGGQKSQKKVKNELRSLEKSQF